MMRVDVDEVKYYVEEIWMLVWFVNLYYCLLKFEEFEYNHLVHIEEVYDREYQR
jgi:hypothetical protein